MFKCVWGRRSAYKECENESKWKLPIHTYNWFPELGTIRFPNGKRQICNWLGRTCLDCLVRQGGELGGIEKIFSTAWLTPVSFSHNSYHFWQGEGRTYIHVILFGTWIGVGIFLLPYTNKRELECQTSYTDHWDHHDTATTFIRTRISIGECINVGRWEKRA